jgi:hypothetical protein
MGEQRSCEVQRSEHALICYISTTCGEIMNKLEKATFALAKASSGNPVLSTATVMLFYVMFNLLEANIEKLLFGERFEHWLDPILMLVFIAYSGYAVWWCAIFNASKET